jgi:hypothetical protein
MKTMPILIQAIQQGRLEPIKLEHCIVDGIMHRKYLDFYQCFYIISGKVDSLLCSTLFCFNKKKELQVQDYSIPYISTKYYFGNDVKKNIETKDVKTHIVNEGINVLQQYNKHKGGYIVKVGYDQEYKERTSYLYVDYNPYAYEGCFGYEPTVCSRFTYDKMPDYYKELGAKENESLADFHHRIGNMFLSPDEARASIQYVKYKMDKLKAGDFSRGETNATVMKNMLLDE